MIKRLFYPIMMILLTNVGCLKAEETGIRLNSDKSDLEIVVYYMNFQALSIMPVSAEMMKEQYDIKIVITDFFYHYEDFLSEIEALSFQEVESNNSENIRLLIEFYEKGELKYEIVDDRYDEIPRIIVNKKYVLPVEPFFQLIERFGLPTIYP